MATYWLDIVAWVVGDLGQYVTWLIADKQQERAARLPIDSLAEDCPEHGQRNGPLEALWIVGRRGEWVTDY